MTTPTLPARRRWTREELLIVLDLYCRIPFGQFDYHNPQVIRVAEAVERTPSAVAMKLGNLASLDPGLKQRGVSGLGNASASDKAIWQEMHADWTAFTSESLTARQNHGLVDKAESTEALESEAVRDRITEREATTTQRVGQNFFRDALLSAYNYKCCIPGLTLEPLLVASHIVPWRDDAKNRLNPRNGLLLSVLHDKAFDRGFLTLDDDLIIRVARGHIPSADEFFVQSVASYDGQAISPPEKFRPHPDFLAYHRENIFLG
ncbi:MAG: HNH endonuclease [Chloroflexi bacterium]|nr:HNH endonuclease [Chloroflexota bacterium]